MAAGTGLRYATAMAPHERTRGRLARGLWLAAGILLTGIGIAGIVLPLLPGVVFLILAAACFARSSPRLEAWILDHPRFGAPVRDWRTRGAIPLRGKLMAGGGIAGGFVVFLFAARPELPLALMVGGVMAACWAWILSRPS
jgi:hypothetical protein